MDPLAGAIVRCPSCGEMCPATMATCPKDGSPLGEVTLDPSGALPNRELTPGTDVGGFVIEAQVGRGGMGVVYCAMNAAIGKRAAIKVIAAERCVRADAVERFLQEARAANAIGHAAIVDVFAHGALPDGRRYLIMEWLEGEPLSKRLARGQLELDVAVEFLLQICQPLLAAHSRGVIHRDLKPDNIYLVDDEHDGSIRPKLLDFGIAKLTHAEMESQVSTSTGVILGTPLYMSPEQARSRAVDEQTDVYSLGCIAFEMLTGRAPYLASSPVEVMALHISGEIPRAGEFRDRLPEALEALVVMMLDKEPARRPTVEDVRRQLVEVRAAGLGTAPPARRSSSALIGGAAILAVATLVMMAIRARSSHPAPDRAPAPREAAQPHQQVGPAPAPGSTAAEQAPAPVEPAPVEPAPAATIAPPMTAPEGAPPPRRVVKRGAGKPPPIEHAAAPVTDAPAPSEPPVVEASPVSPVVTTPDAGTRTGKIDPSVTLDPFHK